MSNNGYMDKEDVVCIIYKMDYYSALRKKEILRFVTTGIDIEGIIVN